MDDVGGHPYGRQRRPQLVRHVGHEPPLHPRQVLQLLNLQLKVLRHLVEGLAQTGDVVLAGDLHPLLETPGGQPLGDPGRHPHRRDDLAHDQPGDGPEQDDHEQPRGRQRALDQAQRLLLLREREEVVQLVRVAVGVIDLLADDKGRLGLLVGVVDDPRVALGRRSTAVDPLPQVLGHAGARVDVVRGARTASAAAVPAGGQRHDLEGALATAGQRFHQVTHPLDDVLVGPAVRGGGAVAGPGPQARLVGLLLGRGETAGGLGLRGLHLGVQQAIAHLPDDHEAQQQHDAQRHQQGRDHDLELDIAPPQPHDRQQRPTHPAHEQPKDRTALDSALEQPALQESSPAGACRPPADRPPRAGPGPSGRRSGTVTGHVSSAPPCNRHHGRSPRSPAARGPSRPWSAAAVHGH